MGQLRKYGIGTVVGLALIVVASLITSSVQRANQPMFEGKTADEWLEQVEADRVRQGMPMYNLDDLTRKELTAAFLSLGIEGQTELLQSYLDFSFPSGWRTNLYALNARLPGWARVKLFSDPVQRHQLESETLDLITPPWTVVEPLVASRMTSRSVFELRSLDYLFGMIGEGATNVVPFLVEGRTNRPSFALQSLRFLKEAASNAVPALVEDLREGRESLQHMHILRQIGPGAADALPALEKLLEAGSSPVDSQSIAAAILAIDQDHVAALAHLDDYFAQVAATKKLEWAEWYCLYWIKGPNTPTAELLLKYLDKSDNVQTPGRILLNLDPKIGLPVLHRKLVEMTERSNLAAVLLHHDPYDAVTLNYLIDQLRAEPFSQDEFAMQWFYALRYCYSDSPGVMNALDHAASVARDENVLEQIRITRRHIELNDILRDLRDR